MKKSLKRTNLFVSLGLTVTTLSATIPGQVIMANTNGTPTTISADDSRTATKHTVSFDLNGLSGQTMDSIIIEHNQYLDLSSLEIPTNVKDHMTYSFAGWYQDEGCTIPFGDTHQVTEDMTVYAKWTGSIYGDEPRNITLHTNGGNLYYQSAGSDVPAANTMEYLYNHTVNLTETFGIERENYVFGGWYLDSSCTLPYPDGAKIYNDLDVYAKWTATVTLGFVLNGGEGDFPTQRVIVGGHPVEPETIPTKEGYDFVGWYVNGALTTPMNFETWVMNRSGNVFAKWERRTHEITFDLNGGEGDFPTQEVNEGEFVIAPTTEPTKEGYRFAGWFADGNLTVPFDFEGFEVMQEGTIFAKWEPLPTYTVNFNLNHGIGDFPIQNVYQGGYVIEPTSEPTRSGYVFDGWYADNAFTTEFDFENTEINENTTIYAKWNRTYTLAFNLNGGEGSIPTQVIAAGGNPTEPDTIPTKEGYDFVGWYVDGNLTIPMNFDTWEMSKNGSVFAKWEAKEYTMTFDFNGGAGEVDELVVKYDETPEVDFTPSRAGYVFDGWYYMENGQVVDVDLDTYIMKEDITIYAKWRPTNVRYTLRFNLNGGSGSFPAQSILEGAKPIAPSKEPTKAGYTFAGWFIDAELTTPMIFESWYMHENCTVYAKWIAN